MFYLQLFVAKDDIVLIIYNGLFDILKAQVTGKGYQQTAEVGYRLGFESTLAVGADQTVVGGAHEQ
jgi:hypothetical protein